MHIGKRIRKVRKNNNMEIEKAAEDILTPEELQYIEEGKAVPAESTLYALAGRLDVPAEYFIDYETKDEQLEVRLTDARLFFDGMKARSTERVLKTIARRYPYIHSLKQEIYYLLIKTSYYVLNEEDSNAIHTFDNELWPLVGPEEQLPEQLKELFYSVMGKVNYIKRSYTISHESYFKQVNYSSNRLQTANAYFNSALSLQALHRISEAIKYCQEAIYVYTELNETHRLSKAYLLLGVLHYDCNNYGKAMKHYKDALEIAEQHQFSEIRDKARYNIGDVYKELEEYNHALNYLLQSLHIEKEFRIQTIIRTYFSILEIYYMQRKISQMQNLIAEAENYVDNDTDHYRLQIMKAKLALLQENPDAYETMMDESISYFYEQKMWKELFYLKLDDEMISYYESDNDKQQKFLRIQEETNRQLSKGARMSV
jgi:HTH-type transcriptional regulator, quorum sensing regulator NprR